MSSLPNGIPKTQCRTGLKRSLSCEIIPRVGEGENFRHRESKCKDVYVCACVCVCVRQREIYPTTSFLEGDLRQKEVGGSGEKTGEGGEDQTVKSLNPLDMAGKVRE